MNKDADHRQKEYRQVPGVDAVLGWERVQKAIAEHGRAPVTSAVRHVLDGIRSSIAAGSRTPDTPEIETRVLDWLDAVAAPSLKRVINATGVVIHTNLGRAPLGETVARAINQVMIGYSNLEMDLRSGRRGHRNAHLARLLTFITGADDAIAVNNNAAGILLTLNTLAAGREVIISRGELIEIGGSFRIPDIIAASGARMVEVGTTNKTHLADYEKAINDQTALLLKVHKSNYEIRGFTQEVGLKELSALARSKNLSLVYDIGSGLLRKPENLPLEDEPDVRSSLEHGADLVTFSSDKLLGGPQAGIIAGRRDLVSGLARAPMMRALRVGKLTISALHCVIRAYLNDRTLRHSLPIFAIMEQSETKLRDRAQRLADELNAAGIDAEVIDSVGQCGGGTLPGLELKSYGVALIGPNRSRKHRIAFAEETYARMLSATIPVVGVLRAGRFLLDVLTISDEDFPRIIAAMSDAVYREGKP